MGSSSSTPQGDPWRNVQPPDLENERVDPNLSAVSVRSIDRSYAVATYEENELAKLHDEIGAAGFWQLWWDSKVPEKDKSSFNRISFSSSNPEAIKSEIAKYQNFYAEMRTAMRSVRTGEEGIDRIAEIVDDLITQLEDMAEAAEDGIESTDSTMVYKLHQDFVSKHDKLENMIRRVESSALRKKQKILTEKWEKAMETVKELTEELRTAMTERDEMRNVMIEMRAENERARTGHQQMMEEMTIELRAAVTERDEMRNIINENRAENERSRAGREQMLEENRRILELLEQLTIERSRSSV